VYRIVPLSMTLIDPDRDFKVAIFSDIEYLRNDEIEPYLL